LTDLLPPLGLLEAAKATREPSPLIEGSTLLPPVVLVICVKANENCWKDQHRQAHASRAAAGQSCPSIHDFFSVPGSNCYEIH
jgi:hypothetical protein